MRILLIILIFCLGMVISGSAQNFLLNGDFEEFTDCMTNQGQFENCKHWSAPNKSSPDFLRNCNNLPYSFGVPLNLGGTQVPQSGKAYAGLFLLNDEEFESREYIQGELSEPLEKGKAYVVSFYISWGDWSFFPCDRIGYKFTNEKLVPSKNAKTGKYLKEKSNGKIEFNQQLYRDTENWNLVNYEYRASGGEKYFILGIFGNDINESEYKLLRSMESTSKPAITCHYAYYFIDNISVTPKKAVGSNTLSSD